MIDLIHHLLEYTSIKIKSLYKTELKVTLWIEGRVSVASRYLPIKCSEHTSCQSSDRTLHLKALLSKRVSLRHIKPSCHHT